MKKSLLRISGMMLRYFYLHKRSVSRTLEVIFWPVMELLVWGFVTVYFQTITQDNLTRFIIFLINAMIFWDILYRAQQGVSISIVEDIWTQNILNILISPLKIWEWLLATFIYSFVKILLIVAILSGLAFLLYHFNIIDSLKFYLIPLMAHLFLFGWSLGIFTSGLLLRWGHSVEALIWGIPFLIQPISAIFYPLSILPPWLQVVSRAIPSTYVFEGMRGVIQKGEMPYSYFVNALVLNIIYFVLAAVFFNWMYKKSRQSGRLGRLGMD